MKKRVFITFVMVLLCGIHAAGAAESGSEKVLNKALAKNAHLPIEQSMANIGRLLFASEVLLPRSGDVNAAAGGGKNVSLLTAPDKFGREWFYAYTDKDELTRVFPEGVPFIVMRFEDFVLSIKDKKDIGGVFLNSGSQKSSFPIPMEFLQSD